MLVPASPSDPEAEPNRRAWQVLSQWQKPFLTAFSDSDPITGGAEQYLQKFIPGAQGLEHPTIENAGHFLQEDQGEVWPESSYASSGNDSKLAMNDARRIAGGAGEALKCANGDPGKT